MTTTKNPKVLCITTFNNELYDKYAFNFMKSFKNLLPFDLVVYSEDEMSFMKEKYDYNFEVRKSFECIPELKEFIKKNSKRNEVDKKRSFKYDGIRFCYKVFTVTHCGLNADKKYDYMLWLDSDVFFTKRFELDERFIQEDKLFGYLGRKNVYSECGFLVFNLKHDYINQYFNEMKRMYVSGDIYKLKEWHDSYVWDIVRKRFKKLYNVNSFDISNEINQGDVFGNTFLKEYMYHYKGLRKETMKKL